ncbi:hypothetical protein [Aeromonas bivalvium]|uniref:hypothetical protein n=1 Tax=Aeromonas bivalvium TaxID=440079 RepID=UPI0038CF73DC
MSSIDMNEMGELVRRVARAFVAEEGQFYLSEGDNGAQNIALPLTLDNMVEAIRSVVVEGAARVLGEDLALLILRRSLNGNALTDYGYGLVCSLLEEVCGDLRQMIAEGKDPDAEIARLRAKREAGARS